MSSSVTSHDFIGQEAHFLEVFFAAVFFAVFLAEDFLHSQDSQQQDFLEAAFFVVVFFVAVLAAIFFVETKRPLVSRLIICFVFFLVCFFLFEKNLLHVLKLSN